VYELIDDIICSLDDNEEIPLSDINVVSQLTLTFEDCKPKSFSVKRSHKNINVFTYSKDNAINKPSKLVNKYMTLIFSKMSTLSDKDLHHLMKMLNSVIIHYLDKKEDKRLLAKLIAFTNIEE
jgi:hypothetical protein